MGTKRTGYIDAARIFGEFGVQGIPVSGGSQHYDEVSATQNWQLGSRMT